MRVVREAALRTAKMDALVREAVFGLGQSRDHAQWLIWEIGQSVGVQPASIHDLYMARSRGEIGGFTVPAINVRAMAYDTARAIFRVAAGIGAGAFILELARSEMAYTDQRPREFAAVMIGAALREGFRGPLFLQGDHFQVNAAHFAIDPVGEIAAVKQLAQEAIASGFYNIDVDTSPLVDLGQPSLDEQQRPNYEAAADIAAYVREIEPRGTTIALGGEIGEVGAHNSTVAELRAFGTGFAHALERRAGAAPGLAKVSVHTGTMHGGIVQPDGSLADLTPDVAMLTELSRVARTEFGMGGAVQHGASTLPSDIFHQFARAETAEIHLATRFQNILFDSIPGELRQRAYRWLDANAGADRRPADTDAQFYYRARKRALGPFKRELWDLPDIEKDRIADEYDRALGALFAQLGIAGTRDIVTAHVRPAVQHRRRVPDGRATPARGTKAAG